MEGENEVPQYRRRQEGLATHRHLLAEEVMVIAGEMEP